MKLINDFINSNKDIITLAQHEKMQKLIEAYGYPQDVYTDCEHLVVMNYDIPGINVIAIDVDGSSHT